MSMSRFMIAVVFLGAAGIALSLQTSAAEEEFDSNITQISSTAVALGKTQLCLDILEDTKIPNNILTHIIIKHCGLSKHPAVGVCPPNQDEFECPMEVEETERADFQPHN